MPRSAAARALPKVAPPSESPHRRNPTGPRPQSDTSANQAGTSVHPAEPPVEPEDAQITGTSRSLQRRVLGLNVNGHHADEEHPDTPAGQHATGSFASDKKSRRK
jgi:hypothetical protein